MSALLRPGIFLAGTRPPSPETADLWLIRLRWVAIAGMLATTLVAERFVPRLDVRPLVGVLAGIVALNLVWTALNLLWTGLARRRGVVALQLYVDVLALAAMLWFSGGISNPFAAFLSFQIVLAGLLRGARACIGVTLLTLAVIALNRFAPPLPAHSASVAHLGIGVALATLSAFIAFFVLVYVQRVAELQVLAARHSKLALLGRLVGGMSHELNTPLATILLASKDLVEAGRELAAPEVSRLSQTIADEAERAADVIGLMRGHVRPDQGRETVELCEFAHELARRELDRLGFTGELRRVAPEPLPAPVLKAGLAQVLKNLLTNAAQATRAVVAPWIEVAVRRRGERIEIAVADNGPGISPELLPLLGEPFQTTRGGEGGMGLGLYVSSLLAERMDGSLRLETPARGGTCVILSLKVLS